MNGDRILRLKLTELNNFPNGLKISLVLVHIFTFYCSFYVISSSSLWKIDHCPLVSCEISN